MKYYQIICYSVHKHEIATIESRTSYEDAVKRLKEDAVNTYNEEVSSAESESASLQFFGDDYARLALQDDYMWTWEIKEVKTPLISTGTVRYYDEHGRVTIPSVTRKQAFDGKWKPGQPVEIFYRKDGTIVLKPTNN